jgi:hypothetical protein
VLAIAIVIAVVVVIALGAFALIARRRSNKEGVAAFQGHRQTNPVYAEPGDSSAGDQSRPTGLNPSEHEHAVALNPQYAKWSRNEGASPVLDSELYVAHTQTPGSTRPSSGWNPRSASIALDSQQYVAAPERGEENAEEASTVMLDSERYVAFTQTPGSTRPSSERDPQSASIALDSQQYVAAPERGEENAEGASTAMLDSERYVASAHRDLGISTQGESGAYEYTELGERHPDFSI